MENHPVIDSSFPSLCLNEEAVLYLEETRRWAYFLSIIGFIGVGLMILVGVFIGSAMNKYGGSTFASVPAQMVSTVYMLIAIVYFFPILYLFRFAVRMKIGLHESNQESMNAAFKNMKSLFRFMGILSIIVISLYVVALISMLLFSAFRSY